MSAVAVLEMLAAQRFVRFLAAGALNTLFGYAMFVLMLRLGAGLAVALVGSTMAGVLFNFQTSRRLVFRSSRSGLLGRFAGVYAAMLAVNYLALRALAPLGLPHWEAQAFMVLPMALLAFAAQRHFVFRTGLVAT